MDSNFNVESFLHSLKDTKPPWECPQCKKVYKSFDGIEHHLLNFDHTAQSNQGFRKSRLKFAKRRKNNQLSARNAFPVDFKTPTRDTLTWAEAQKMVEVESEGVVYRLNICEKLNIISDSDIDKDKVIVSNVDDSNDHLESMHKTSTSGVASPKKLKSNETFLSNGFISSKDLKSVTLPMGQYVNEHQPVTDESTTTAIATSTLPRPSFRLLPEQERLKPNATFRSAEYFRFVDKPSEEIEKEVEYDMDEEDAVWLKLINEQRLKEGLTHVTPKQLELLIDRFEKESFEKSKQSQDTQSTRSSKDEDVICCICNDEVGQSSSTVLICDKCNLTVHQECYGVPHIPEGQWLCQRCDHSSSKPVDCCLCPNKNGAFKQTDDGRWAHVVCALWIPEVGFRNAVFLEPINGIESISSTRWRLTCCLCKQRGVGACIQCSRNNCRTAFHATCAQQAGFHMKVEPLRRSGRNGEMATEQKGAYCDVHTPFKALSCPSRKNGQLVFEAESETSGSQFKNVHKNHEQKQTEAFHIAMPRIPSDKFSAISRRVSIQKKSSFMQRLLSYWILKRHSRNGAPLLRRLQPHEHARKSRGPEIESQQDQMIEQLKYWNRLRHDLERARLLLELIRKREKLKRETIRISQVISEMQLTSFNVFLKRILNKLGDIDEDKIFAEPVRKKDAPDYHKLIKQPMDFSKMSTKIARHEYKGITDFEDDFNQIVKNCLYYNPRNSIFYGLAVKMREQGSILLRDAKREMKKFGFDPETGMLLVKVPQNSASEILDEKATSSIPTREEMEAMHDKFKEAISNSTKARKLSSLKRRISQSNEKESTPFERPVLSFVKPTSSRRFSADDVFASMAADETDAVFSDIVECARGSLRSSSIKPLRAGKKRFYSFRPSPTLASSSESKRKKAHLERSESCPTDNDQLSADSVVLCERLSPREYSGLTSRAKVSRSTDNPPTDPVKLPTSEKLSFTFQPTSSPINTCSVNRRTSVLFKKKFRNKSTTPSLSSATSPLKDNRATTPLQPNSLKSSPSSNCITKRSRSTSELYPDEVHSPRRMFDRTEEKVNPKETHLQDNDCSEDAGVFDEELVLKRRESFRPGREDRLGRHDSGDSDTAFTATNAAQHRNVLGQDQGRSVKKWRSFSVSCVNNNRFLSDGETPENDTGLSNVPASHQELFRRQSCVSTVEEELENDDLPIVKPLDLVWAKCRGYPPYPALLIDPKMPRSGLRHNGVPIPVPPSDVLHVGDKRVENGNRRIFLVLFFDAKRTWQWLPRSKLELFGLDTECDRAKLSEGRRYAIRKNVEAAYKRALDHRSRVMNGAMGSHEEVGDRVGFGDSDS